MWMCAHFQDVDLSSHFLGHFQVLDLALVEDLYSNLKPRHNMMSDYKVTRHQQDNIRNFMVMAGESLHRTTYV